MSEREYKISQVAAASGLSVAVIKNWERKERKLISREPNKGFTFARALQVGIMAELGRMGIPPETAAKVAFDFTDTGSGPLPGIQPERWPCETFPSGWTMLCIYSDTIFEVKNIQPNGEALSLFLPLGFQRTNSVVALNITFFLQQFRERLGV